MSHREEALRQNQDNALVFPKTSWRRWLGVRLLPPCPGEEEEDGWMGNLLDVAVEQTD